MPVPVPPLASVSIAAGTVVVLGAARSLLRGGGCGAVAFLRRRSGGSPSRLTKSQPQDDGSAAPQPSLTARSQRASKSARAVS